LQRGMMTDTDTIPETFGKNEQVKKVFLCVFIVPAGLVLVTDRRPRNDPADHESDNGCTVLNRPDLPYHFFRPQTSLPDRYQLFIMGIWCI
jgi:hypothetical protein